MNWQTAGSFLYGDVDMFERFGLRITDKGFPEDVLLPTLRPRKITLPMRSGAYDFGAKYYDERPIPQTCVTTKSASREDAREIAWILSKKEQIRFWHDPTVYYVGRVYAAPTLEMLRNIGSRFTLTFVCDPFACGTDVSAVFTNRYTPNYQGTAPTPTVIRIRNTGSTTIHTIHITQTSEEEFE